MSLPAILGPVSMPSAEHYEPRPVDTDHGRDVEAAKELLSWMRHVGIRCQHLKVGGVEIGAIEDDYPRKRPVASPASVDDRDLFEE